METETKHEETDKKEEIKKEKAWILYIVINEWEKGKTFWKIGSCIFHSKEKAEEVAKRHKVEFILTNINKINKHEGKDFTVEELRNLILADPDKLYNYYYMLNEKCREVYPGIFVHSDCPYQIMVKELEYSD